MLAGESFPELRSAIEHGLLGTSNRQRDVRRAFVIEYAALELAHFGRGEASARAVFGLEQAIRPGKCMRERSRIAEPEPAWQRPQHAVQQCTAGGTIAS
jgi:hypothetical protein